MKVTSTRSPGRNPAAFAVTELPGAPLLLDKDRVGTGTGVLVADVGAAVAVGGGVAPSVGTGVAGVGTGVVCPNAVAGPISKASAKSTAGPIRATRTRRRAAGADVCA
ncbi:MAG: hypothetical protein NVSMB2_00440 [Chloroflexota bacterium]